MMTDGPLVMDESLCGEKREAEGRTRSNRWCARDAHNVEEQQGRSIKLPRCDSGRAGSNAGLIGLAATEAKPRQSGLRGTQFWLSDPSDFTSSSPQDTIIRLATWQLESPCLVPQP